MIELGPDRVVQQKQHIKFFELLTVFLVCCRILILLLMNEIFLTSKVHTRSLNLCGCVIPIHKLSKRLNTFIIMVTVPFKSTISNKLCVLLQLGPSTFFSLFGASDAVVPSVCAADVVQQLQAKCKKQTGHASVSEHAKSTK